MTAKRFGSVDTVEGVTALRAVAPGDLHECPDGRVGYYGGTQNVASGGTMVLHTDEVLLLPCASFGTANAGAVANFNFSTQQVVQSGGTDCGTFVKDKAHAATACLVALNNTGRRVAGTSPTTTTTTAAP